jgi:DNA-binding CsgD family transcriptional regulator
MEKSKAIVEDKATKEIAAEHHSSIYIINLQRKNIFRKIDLDKA